MLREYESLYGMPEQGGPHDQEYVLREVMRDLYIGGAPVWTIEPVMERVAEGLTGKRGVDYFLLPRKVFVFAPTSGATVMFRWERGFQIHKLDSAERLAIRLASYASNIHSVNSLPTQLPDPQDLRAAFQRQSTVVFNRPPDKDQLAEDILNLASDAEGLFFYLNSRQAENNQAKRSSGDLEEEEKKEEGPMQAFWKVEESTSELFSRLAAIDAMRRIDEIDEENKKFIYPKWVCTAH
jgi:hypothetical protein